MSTSPAVPVRHLVLVTDAWHPQVNGVVVTLAELVRGLHRRGVQVTLIEPSTFRRMPLPGYPGMEMALWPGRQVARRLAAAQADAVFGGGHGGVVKHLYDHRVALVHQGREANERLATLVDFEQFGHLAKGPGGVALRTVQRGVGAFGRSHGLGGCASAILALAGQAT